METPSSFGRQRRYLRAQAHGLRALVQVGKQGATDPVVGQIDRALADHELIKVQYPAEKAEKQAFAATIEERLDALCAGIIGHVLILYREHKDPEKRRYALPG